MNHSLTKDTKAASSTEEDKVRHAYLGFLGVVYPGDTSLCGLKKWEGEPKRMHPNPPKNACSMCMEIARGLGR